MVDSNNEIEIWSEGYKITGQSGKAICHGKVKGASSLLEAVNILASTNKDFARRLTIKEYKTIEPVITWWGCKIFINKIDAQKSFG